MTMKRLLAAFMAAALCFTMLPFVALAENTAATPAADAPQLWFQAMSFNDDSLIAVDSEIDLSSGRDLPIGNTFFAAFYFGTSSADAVLVSAEALDTKNSRLSLEPVDESKLADKSLAGYAVEVCAEDFGNSAVIYTTTADEEYSLPIAVTLPGVAYFDSAKRSESTYLDEQLLKGAANEPETAYLMWDTSIFTVSDKSAFHVRLNNIDTDTDKIVNGTWTDDVDDTLADEGITLTPAFDKGYVAVTADFRAELELRISLEGWSAWLRIEPEAAPGLRFRWVDNDENDNYFPEGDFSEELSNPIDSSTWMAVYYVDGDEETLIPLDDLDIPDITTAELLDEDNPNYFRLRFKAFGTGEITCDDYPGSIPVTVELPRVSFYSTTTRAEESYVGEQLSYTGENTVYYLLVEEDFTITEIVPDPENNGYDMSFFRSEIMENGAYAKVTLNEGFGSDGYDLQVKMSRANSSKVYEDNLWLKIEDARPGLRYRYVDVDDDDNYFVEDELNNTLDVPIERNAWLAVYYVDGETETLIPLEDLKIPALAEAELLDEDNPYYFQFGTTSFGTGAITSRKHSGSIPVTVGLPWVAFYSSTTRDETSYLGDRLSFNGAYTDEDGEVCDLVYILTEDGWRFTDLKLLSAEMDFFSYEIADDGSFIEVMLKEGFTDRGYEIRVYMESTNGNSRNNTRMWFKLTDDRPGLRWCWLDRDDQPELDDLQSSMDFSMGDSTSLAIVYDDKVNTPVAVDFDSLSFPDFMEASKEDDYLRLDFLTVGNGKITSSDYPGCSIPVIVTLPDVGIFKEPVISVDTYLGDTLSAMPGETATAYLVWDPDIIEEVDDILVTFEYGQDWETLLDRVSLEDAEEILEDHGVFLTPFEKSGYVKIEAKMDVIKSLHLFVCEGNARWGTWLRIDNEIAVRIKDWRSNKRNPVITYNGEEYSFGIGRIDQESGKFDMFHAGSGFGSTTGQEDATLNETVYLGAMVDFDTREEDAAPSWVYDCISDVSFDIVDYINAHDLSDQAEPNVFIDRTYTSTFNGCQMATVDIDTVPGGFVEALLRVSFTVTMPDEEPVRCTVDNVVHLAYNHTIYPDMREIDTADELNEILSGMDAFLSWIKDQDQKKGTDMYVQYMANQSLNWEATYELHLPAVTYDDIIEVNLSGVEFEISGSTDSETGKRTTMPGMWLHKNNLFFLSNIDFVAVPGITQEYNGETFTCGVLAFGDNMDDHQGDAYTIHGCSFTGFDYGVRNTPYGYACVGGRNHFNNCGVGYLIDCAGKRSGNANDTTSDCIFENCKEAIKILALPEYISPYDYRIHNCDFINNNKDIVSELDGRLYCYFNYFGHYTRGASSLADVTDADQIQSRPSGIKEKNHATIITNPRYALPVRALGFGIDNYLIIDNGRATYIFNSQSGDMLLDAEALTAIVESSAEDITINVMSDNEEVQGTWTFNGTEE